jgi:H+/gluconate symporter-like permease
VTVGVGPPSYPGAVLAADTPSVTDWMQGWGSLLAVITSLVAIIFTALLLRHEVRARRQDQAEMMAGQARLRDVS